MQYFILPKCCIAFNAKVASTSLAFSIVQKYYPEKLQECLDKFNQSVARLSPEIISKLPDSIQKTILNQNLDSASFWQTVCQRTNHPDKPVLLLMRDPVDRFISGVAYLGIDVEQILSALENDTNFVFQTLSRPARKDTHLLPQHIYNGPNTKIYKFPEQLENFCNDAEVDYPLPKINEGKNIKPILNSDQIARIKQYYAEDVKLFEMLN